MRGVLVLVGLMTGLAGSAGAQPMPGVVIAGDTGTPQANGCRRTAVVSGNPDAGMRVRPVLACRSDDRAPPASVAIPYHRGEVAEDYDLVCSSNPAELGEYAWDVDKDRYVHAGRVEFTPAEQARTLMVQVSGANAKAWLPARLGGNGWIMLDGAANSGGVRARLANGASFTVSPTMRQVTIRTKKKLLYSGRCALITAVGSRAW